MNDTKELRAAEGCAPMTGSRWRCQWGRLRDKGPCGNLTGRYLIHPETGERFPTCSTHEAVARQERLPVHPYENR